MTDRHTVNSLTSDALDQLYAQLARAERAVRRAEGSESWMAKHLARQDSRVNGLTRDRDRQRDRAARAEATLARVHALADDWHRTGQDPNACIDMDDAAEAIHAALAAPVSSGPAATQATGIRGLLEHVGIDTTGRDITVAGKAVDADPDDPPVQCWHTEPDTPCDWNVCKQPERLAAGDYGTDPREQH